MSVKYIYIIIITLICFIIILLLCWYYRVEQKLFDILPRYHKLSNRVGTDGVKINCESKRLLVDPSNSMLIARPASRRALTL